VEVFFVEGHEGSIYLPESNLRNVYDLVIAAFFLT
jgi:hypothetical protein